MNLATELGVLRWRIYHFRPLATTGLSFVFTTVGVFIGRSALCTGQLAHAKIQVERPKGTCVPASSLLQLYYHAVRMILMRDLPRCLTDFGRPGDVARKSCGKRYKTRDGNEFQHQGSSCHQPLSCKHETGICAFPTELQCGLAIWALSLVGWRSATITNQHCGAVREQTATHKIDTRRNEIPWQL